jgi:hypothetical protein
MPQKLLGDCGEMYRAHAGMVSTKFLSVRYMNVIGDEFSCPYEVDKWRVFEPNMQLNTKHEPMVMGRRVDI